ncbi:MAG: GNAT family N-acetyltransferase [Actinomycetota bacterium]
MTENPFDRFEFADDEVVPIQELVDLYHSVNWLAYAADPDGLARAVDRSTYVVTARDHDGGLAGLARCLSDDVSIMYLQDVLVHPDHQGRGVGSTLVKICVQKFDHVRQKVLLTDDEPRQAEFYEALGYTNLRDFGPPTVNAFVQFRSLTTGRDHDGDDG